MIRNDTTFSKKNVFSLSGQILYKLAFCHITHKKEERKERHCDVTENMWCHLTATVVPLFAHDLFPVSWNKCEKYASGARAWGSVYIVVGSSAQNGRKDTRFEYESQDNPSF